MNLTRWYDWSTVPTEKPGEFMVTFSRRWFFFLHPGYWWYRKNLWREHR